MSQLIVVEAPERGFAHVEAPGIRRVVARNAGPMTYHGTNTWLVDTARGQAIIDPGPDDPQHLRELVTIAGSINCILLTHHHRDHAGGMAAMQAATGAPVFDYAAFRAGQTLPPALAGWTPIETPGHAADHLCFAREDGVMLTGDLVFGWTTGLVDDMAAYMASLHLLLTRADRLYLPGHGPPITQPARLVRALLHHRLAREAAILGSLAEAPRNIEWLLARHYPGLASSLHGAALVNLRAHLRKLEADGRILATASLWQSKGSPLAVPPGVPPAMPPGP